MELSGKDASFIAYLSSFLHANGNEVLVGKKKLSLTSSVLCILNKLYIDPNSDISTKASNDLQLSENWNFLLNVISNVIALKVTHCVETVQGGINLSMFKSLLMLELKKTPIHLFLGLNKLSSQLETLVCSCSISSLHELLGNSTNSMEWSAMKQLNLAHNYLEDLEEDIRLFPNLQIIDASHNRLINANGLKFLTKLYAVNLGYNNLSKVPTFSNESYSYLKELSLRNNNLEDLNGLENIRYIQDLDLSYNCLSEHSVLYPIQNLPYLQVLKLVGNPFAVQRLHRILTAKHFHPNVIAVGIKLDGHKLTKTEIGKVVQVRSINVHSYHNSGNGNRIQTNSSLENNVNIGNVRVLPTICYPSSSSVDYISVANGSSLKDDTGSVTSISSDIRKASSKSKGKKRKEKEIIIEDCGNSNQHNLNDNIPENKKCKAQELKVKLIARREHLGQEWLVSTYSSSLSSEHILTSTSIGSVTNESNSLKKMSQDQDAATTREFGNNVEDLTSSKISLSTEDAKEELGKIKHSEKSVDNADEKALKKISVTSDGIEVICSDHVHQDELDDNDFNICKSCMQTDREDSADDINFQNNENAYNIKYGIVEDDENPESNIFLVDKKVGDNITTTIFISIGEKYLNEKDVLSADLLDSLDLSVLDNAEILEKNIIKLEFKIFKVSKRERIYYAENETAAKEILNLLLPHAEVRNLKSIIKNALKCLKCDAQFTRNIFNQRFLSDSNHQLASYILVGNSSSKVESEDKDICPVCESLMIVEDNECPISITLLEKANYSPVAISGYLFTPQNATSSVSTELPPNLLLSFKYPLKVKQNTALHVLNKTDVCRDDSVNNSDSDESSVCTALEYTSQELAINCSSTNSLESAHSNDNLNNGTKKLLSVTEIADSSQIIKYEENEQVNLQNTKTQDKITVFDTSVQKTGNGEFRNMIDIAEKITYDTFTNINHTLKLYIEMQLFDANEELEASAEALIVSHSTTAKNKGLLLLSTKRLHFMKVAGNLSDEPEKNVTPLEAVKLNQLSTVLIFVGNQGASFVWGKEKNPSEYKACYTCLFSDADYCCSFITYFVDFIKQKVPLPPTINSSSEDNLAQIKQEILFAKAYNGKPLASDISTEILAFILLEWCQLASSEKEHEIVALILTSTDICITKILFTKQHSKSIKFSKPVERYIPIAKQKITNLISVHPHFDSCKLGLHFLDEDSGNELYWVIVAKTKRALYLFINTLKEPWQESFGVEMKLEAPINCKCNM